MKKMLTLTILILMALSLLPVHPSRANASPAIQDDVTTAELLTELSNQLVSIGRATEKRGRTNEARAWYQWAAIYRAAASTAGDIPATTFLSQTIRSYRIGTRQAKSARLYGIAKVFSIWHDFWIDVRDDLGDDVSDLDVSFPKSVLFLFSNAPIPVQSAIPRACDQAAYNKCMEFANSMTGSTSDYGTGTSRSTGLNSSGLMMSSTCRMYLAGCN